jgi:cytidylate kinase
MIIAIDGPAAAGKGTLARRLAAAIGLPYLDTGLLYRAVGRRVLDAGLDPADADHAAAQAQALTAADLGRLDLRVPEVDRAASMVGGVPSVRAALLAFQRSFADGPGAVLDGRDIGTVIFPDAAVKLFITASVEARAERRWRERADAPDAPSLDKVTAEIAARDAADERRATAPLRPASDATVIDTTQLDADAVFATAMQAVQAAQCGAARDA